MTVAKGANAARDVPSETSLVVLVVPARLSMIGEVKGSLTGKVDLTKRKYSEHACAEPHRFRIQFQISEHVLSQLNKQILFSNFTSKEREIKLFLYLLLF